MCDSQYGCVTTQQTHLMKMFNQWNVPEVKIYRKNTFVKKFIKQIKQASERKKNARKRKMNKVNTNDMVKRAFVVFYVIHSPHLIFSTSINFVYLPFFSHSFSRWLKLGWQHWLHNWYDRSKAPNAQFHIVIFRQPMHRQFNINRIWNCWYQHCQQINQFRFFFSLSFAK